MNICIVEILRSAGLLKMNIRSGKRQCSNGTRWLFLHLKCEGCHGTCWLLCGLFFMCSNFYQSDLHNGTCRFSKFTMKKQQELDLSNLVMVIESA